MSQSNRNLFGTDGIRGEVNQHPMTVETAMRTGRAVAAWLKGGGSTLQAPTVLVGRDTRNSGEMLEMALCAGLISGGASPVRLGVVPTPAVACNTRLLRADAGVMITASHNPFQDNGLKIFGPDGYKLADALESSIETFILDAPANSGLVPPADLGTCRCDDNGLQNYLDFARSSAPELDLRGIRLVLDCGNGAAFAAAPDLFRQLGAEVILHGTSPNGTNINLDCGALHTSQAGQLVRQHQADLGISLDGDADRVIFTDASGQEVSGDRIMALCALHLKSQGRLRNDTLVTTVMSNLGLIEAMQKHGIRVETTAVGDRHVMQRMISGDFNFGGENSGHLIFHDFATTGDGIVSALQVLQMMKSRHATLAELAGVMSEYPAKLANLRVPAKPALESLPKLQALMRAATSDFGAIGRHLIRYSGTENKIRVLVEHRDASTCEAWIQRFTDAIREEIG